MEYLRLINIHLPDASAAAAESNLVVGIYEKL